MKLRLLLTFFFILLLPSLVSARDANFRSAFADISAASPAYERAVISEEGGLYLYSGEGKLLSGFPVFFPDRVFVSSPIFANLKGDGKKSIAAITRDASGVYQLVMIDSQGQLVTEAVISGSTYFDPVSLKVNSQRDHILFATEQGKVFEVVFANNMLNFSEILDAQAPVGITADPAGFRFFLSFQKTNVLKLYQKSGDLWNVQKTFTLPNPIIYPVLYDGSQRVYYITDSGSLITLDITILGTKFWTLLASFSSLPLDAPFFAEVDSTNPGKEIVVNLSSGQRVAVSTAGKILSLSLQDKNFEENSIDTAELNDGLYAPVRSFGSSLVRSEKNLLSSLFSRSKFDMSWWQDVASSLFVGTYSGTKLDSVNNVLTMDTSPPLYLQFEQNGWKNPKEVTNTFNSANNGTALNGALSVVSGKFGRGLQLDGIDDYISIPSVYGNSPGWTVSAWYKTDVQNSSYMSPVSSNNGGRLGIFIYQGHPGCRIWDTKEHSVYTSVVTTGAWHHMTCVYENGSKPSTALYVDGVLKKSVQYSSVTAGDYWYVGKPGSTIFTYYQGLVDEVSVSNRVLSALEVSALYNQQYGSFVSEVQDAGQVKAWSSLKPVPLAPYGKEFPDNQKSETAYASGNVNMSQNILLLHMNDAAGATVFADGSGLNHSGVCTGPSCPISGSGRFGNALQMDGVNDYLTVAQKPDLQFTDNFTAMGWVKRDKFSGWDGFFGKLKYAKKGTVLSMSGWNLNFDFPSRKIAATLACNGVYKIIYSNVKDDLLLHHVALRVEAGKASLFIDGLEQADSTTTPVCDSGQDFIVGKYYSDSADHTLQGSVDEVAVFHRPFSSAEILDSYKRGAMRVLYQARSCDDAGCSGESFVGPDQTSFSSFSELQNTTEGLPSFSLNVPANRYFQYFVRFVLDNSLYAPGLSKVDIN